MKLSGSSQNCTEDFLQFGRDVLFITTHLRYRVINFNLPTGTNLQGVRKNVPLLQQVSKNNHFKVGKIKLKKYFFPNTLEIFILNYLHLKIADCKWFALILAVNRSLIISSSVPKFVEQSPDLGWQERRDYSCRTLQNLINSVLLASPDITPRSRTRKWICGSSWADLSTMPGVQKRNFSGFFSLHIEKSVIREIISTELVTGRTGRKTVLNHHQKVSELKYFPVAASEPSSGVMDTWTVQLQRNILLLTRWTLFKLS